MIKTFFTGALQRGMLSALAIALAYIGWLKYDISQLENDVLTRDVSLVDERSEHNICKAIIKEKNEQVIVAKETSAVFETIIRDLSLNIATKEGENNVIIDLLRKQDAPVSCEDIGRYLRENLEELTWKD